MKRLSDDPAVRLAECRGESVPPASGEVQVIGYRINTEAPAVSGYTLTLNPVAEGKYQVPVADYAHVARLQAEVEREAGLHKHWLKVCGELTAERDALKAEVKRLTQQFKVSKNDKGSNSSSDGDSGPSASISDSSLLDALKLPGRREHQSHGLTVLDSEIDGWNSCHDVFMPSLTRLSANRDTLQSRLAQATAIIDYLSLHTELDGIAKSDIDKFYAGSTDAEKAARAEMVRVGDEPAEGVL